MPSPLPRAASQASGTRSASRTGPLAPSLWWPARPGVDREVLRQREHLQADHLTPPPRPIAARRRRADLALRQTGPTRSQRLPADGLRRRPPGALRRLHPRRGTRAARTPRSASSRAYTRLEVLDPQEQSRRRPANWRAANEACSMRGPVGSAARRMPVWAPGGRHGPGQRLARTVARDARARPHSS